MTARSSKEDISFRRLIGSSTIMERRSDKLMRWILLRPASYDAVRDLLAEDKSLPFSSARR